MRLAEPIAPLRLPPEPRTRLLQLAAAAYPNEGCGLVLAAAEPRRIAAVWQLHNAATAPQAQFEFDPLEYLHAERAAEAAGLRPLGVWHSHPDGTPMPSAEDQAAAWEGWSYLIVATTRAGACGLRSWQLQDGRFLEEVIRP